jgi:hypothetical protein
MAMIKRRTVMTAAVLASVAVTCGVAAANSAAGSAAVRGSARSVSAARAPTTFVAISAAAPTRLARYSATTGRLLKFLTSPEPGGGVGAPELSANGRTVVFARADGTCAYTIDTVPASGGAEQVLIPMTGSGATAAFPFGASLSPDGRYMLYSLTPCADLGHHTLYLRDLRTGRTIRLGRGPQLMFPAAFFDHDRQAAYNPFGIGKLTIARLRPLQLRYHIPPRGCLYGPLATPGTGKLLTAALDCGSLVKVVDLSPSSLRVTRTVASVAGSCVRALSISVAQRDPHAVLLEVAGCHNTERILTISDGKTTVVRSGRELRMPQSPAW